MGIWKKQQPANSPATQKSARPAPRQHVDDIRRKAQHYTDITEQSGNQSNDRSKATRQREQAEKEMAALRAEALQARRLATQIENLHQPVQVQRKGRIMDTTIADPGQAQRMARRNTDSPSSGGGKFNFNPLHPSMELPPEQLIRLLGLDDKPKRRKKSRPGTVAARTEKHNSTDDTAAVKPVKLSLPKTPPASAERERDMVPPSFEESRRNLLVPSLIAGVVAGIAISAYLFWSSPEDVAPSATQVAPVLKTNKNAKPLPAATRPAPVVAPTEPARQGTVKRTKVVPQSEINAEEKRLHSEAEQRFAERMTEQDTSREREALSTDISLPAVIEPAISEPPATTEMDTPESSIPEPQATTPGNEAPLAEINTELDITTDAVTVAEPNLTPAEPAEAELVQDSGGANESVGEDLF